MFYWILSVILIEELMFKKRVFFLLLFLYLLMASSSFSMPVRPPALTQHTPNIEAVANATALIPPEFREEIEFQVHANIPFELAGGDVNQLSETALDVCRYLDPNMESVSKFYTNTYFKKGAHDADHISFFVIKKVICIGDSRVLRLHANLSHETIINCIQLSNRFNNVQFHLLKSPDKILKNIRYWVYQDLGLVE